MSDHLTSPRRAQKPRYRPAVQVSAEIRNHCHIYLDEQLYISALTLLTDLVTSGASHPKHLATPAFAPVPFHIEIVSALLVHPRHTTQAPRNERAELASRSIAFLRSLLATLGPLNGNLGEAFSLTPPRIRGSRRSRNGGDEGSSESDGEGEEHMGGIVANKGRLRRSAKDFWHIVGWAFNCSVVHQKRWKYWKVWLEYMLDVLDADWNEREEKDREEYSKATGLEEDSEAECQFEMLRNSLLVKYLSDVKGRSSAAKRVVGAAFTDGGPEDLRSYPEVFPNETKEVQTQSGQKRKRGDDDLKESSDYDHGDEAAFESSQPTDETPESSQNTTDGVETPDPWMGGPESILLRQRVLTLLSRVAALLPDCFIDCRELYEIYCLNMKMLPLPAFSLLVSPSNSSHFPLEVFVSLTQLLLVRLIPNTAPRPRSVSNRDTDDLTQEILEKCFLPYTASTSSIADNAKVSILVENLFRVFLKSCPAYYTPDLEAAIEKGIRAREAKIKSDKRRKENGMLKKEEESDAIWLKASGQRLRRLLEWVEQKTQDDGVQ